MKGIGTLELMAAWLGLEVCTAECPGVRTFLYADNEAARACLIAMYSSLDVHNVTLKGLSEIAHSRILFCGQLKCHLLAMKQMHPHGRSRWMDSCPKVLP